MHIEIASIGQFQCVPTTYVTEIKEFILKYTLKKYHVRWLSSFKHLNLPISIKIPTTLSCIWQIVYIYLTAISMNYAFAKLVVA